MNSRKKKTTASLSKKNGGKNPAKKALSKNKSDKKPANDVGTPISVLNESIPSYSIHSRIRSIGNSKGVILPNRVIEEAGLSQNAELIIQVSDGVILIAEARSSGLVNTNLSSWDEQFKNAVKKGCKPEANLWEGIQNRFDEEEWS